MKSNLLRTVLEWVLITSLLFSCGFLTWYYFNSRKARSLRAQAVALQTKLQQFQPAMTAAMNDVLEYAKTHKEIIPTLQSLNLFSPGNPQPAPVQPKPAGK